MSNAHEPSSAFVERLEWQVGVEARRRNREAEVRRWTPRSRRTLILAACGLALVSMGIGAGAVAVAYEAESQERRDQLTVAVEQRVGLARQRLALAESELVDIDRRIATGVESNEAALEARIKVAEARALVRTAELDLEEIRLSAVEPRRELSAPRVSGRDFVGERLRIEQSVPEAAVALERARLRGAETRVSVGVVDPAEVEAARSRLLDVELALETFRRKVEIRQKFLSGSVDAVETELRVLEAEAEQRKKSLGPKLDMARQDVTRFKARVEVGTAAPVEVSMASLRLLELQMKLAEADVELSLIRARILKLRAGR